MRPLLLACALPWALACAKAPPPEAPSPATTAPPEAHADDVSQASRTGWADKDDAARRDAAALRRAPTVAILRVTRVDDECSSSGGTHLTLEPVKVLKGAAPKAVAAGGHALWIDARVGDLYLAGVGPPAADARAAKPEWCLKDLPAVDGYATTLVKTDSEAAGEARLREILGSPP